MADRLRLAMGETTPVELAEAADCSAAMVRLILSGKRNPSRDLEARLADALGVSHAWLATGEGKRSGGRGSYEQGFRDGEKAGYARAWREIEATARRNKP